MNDGKDIDRQLAEWGLGALPKKDVILTLFSAELYVPGTMDEGNTTFLSISDDDGPIIPVFASEQGVREFLDSQDDAVSGYLKLPGRDFLDNEPHLRFLVNPHHPYALLLTAEDIASAIG